MGVKIMAVLFFGLACILVIGAPEAVIGRDLGDPGPALLPRVAGYCMGLLAVVLLIQKPAPLEPGDSAIERPMLIGLSLIAVPLFYLMFQHLGYTIAAGLYLFAAFYILGNHNSAALVRYALAATAFSLASGLILSRLLDLPLPGVIP